MQKTSIIVKDISIKTIEATVLDRVSFSLLPSQHLAILGDADSGKTMLAKALAGKVAYSGQICFDFEGLTDMPVRNFVEQRYSFKNLSGTADFYYQQRFNSQESGDAPTVWNELIKSSQLSCSSEEDSKRTNIADSVLESLGITYLKNTPLIQLSSGEHKKFQLAKALVNPAHILILDNPYNGLDVTARAGLDQLLAHLAKNGTQVIIIPGTFEVPAFITDIAYLSDKKLAFFGSKEDFTGIDFFTDVHPAKQSSVFDGKLLPQQGGFDGSAAIIEMKNTEIRYGAKVIVKNINWTIKQGEKWLLKGRNGAGKSSLLSMISGDHPQAYSNEIYLFGKRRGSGESIWDIKRQTGYISPELHAYFDKSVSCYQAIGSGYFDTVGLFKKLSAAQHSNILQWLDFLQLSHVSKKPLHSISASLQRMILLARALVKNPPLLILDEPCQGLDHNQSVQFVSLIDHVCSGSTRTLIYVSHDMSNVPKCVERVFELTSEGQKIYAAGKRVAVMA